MTMFFKNLQFSIDEANLALRYLSGEVNDTQFNFLIVQNNFDENKIKKIANEFSKVRNIVNITYNIFVWSIIFAAIYFILKR